MLASGAQRSAKKWRAFTRKRTLASFAVISAESSFNAPGKDKGRSNRSEVDGVSNRNERCVPQLPSAYNGTGLGAKSRFRPQTTLPKHNAPHFIPRLIAWLKTFGRSTSKATESLKRVSSLGFGCDASRMLIAGWVIPALFAS